MALERRNINIPISGGENQGEDSYLLKPPFLKVLNGFYKKDGSIKKRGAYKFLASGLSSSATPFVLKDMLHIIDNSIVYKWRTPASPITRTLSAESVAVPSTVHTLPSQNDGALEVVAAANAGTVMVVWSQPVAPDPDSADVTYKKHLHVFAAQYDENDLVNPTAGPFKLTDGGTEVDLEEISLIYTGGYWCISGIRRAGSQVRLAILQNLTSGALTWLTVSGGFPVDNYDVTYVPGATSLYYVMHNQNDTTSTTAASRTWGDMLGVNCAITGVGTATFNRVTIGTVGSTPNLVGDKACAIHAKGSTLWIAVASVRHDNIYVYTTNLSFGSVSAATLVHTHVAGEPFVNGNWGGFLTGTKGSRAYPYYEDQQAVVPSTVDGTWGTDFGGGNDRIGRLAISTTSTGVRVYWDGPIIEDTATDHCGGYGTPATWPSVWGVCWKTVSDAFSVNPTLGNAPCSYLASKPMPSGTRDLVVLGMSNLIRWTPGNPLNATFAPKNSHKGLVNTWFVDQPGRAAAWRMGQLCLVSGAKATPVSQFGADLLMGKEWGMKDAARIYTKGSEEAPQVSTRRMEYLFETSERKIVFGAAYLVRGAPANYERPGASSFNYSASMDAHMAKGVVVAFDQQLSPRTSSVVVGEEAVLANGWLSVFDGDDLREASPNFIPPTDVTAATDRLFASWFVTDKNNKTLRTSRSNTGQAYTAGADPMFVFGPPPSYGATASKMRFEVWSPSERIGVGDPARFSTSGPFIYTQRMLNGDGEAADTSSALQPEPIGGCTYVTATSNRVWYIEPEDVARVRFSKDFSVLGRLEFNRNLFVDIPDGSRPVAVASLDEQVVIFTDRSVYLVTGNLPNNAGGGSNFYLQKVAFEEGCTNRYSILESRVGVFFESKRGINLLTRGYEVVYVGSPVEDSASGGSSLTGACYLPSQDLFCFTTDTKTLVCHESGGQFRWTEWLYEHDGGIVASCAWGDYHVVIDSDGNLYYMDFADVTDVILSFTTPWLYFGDLEGFQRIRDINLVGRNATTSGVAGSCVLQVGYDFIDSFDETVYYEYGPDLGSSPMRIRFKPGRQKSSSFRLRFVEVAEAIDEQSTLLNADVTIAGISVEVGIKAMGNKTARNTPTTPS